MQWITWLDGSLRIQPPLISSRYCLQNATRDQSERKSTQVHARPDQTESQVDSSFLYLRLLANPFGRGLELPTITKSPSGKIRGLIPWSLAYKICSKTRVCCTIQGTSSVRGVFGTSFRISQDQEQSKAAKYESWRHKRAGVICSRKTKMISRRVGWSSTCQNIAPE